MPAKKLYILLFALLMIAGCGEDKRPFMVVAANVHAAKAGRDVLQKGGSAIDAAITVQLVLGLVEPQSSGIGGGAYMLHWDERRAMISAYDGRETAPKHAGPGLFLKPDGTPMKFFEAAIGGRATGVPGVIAMLWQAHQAHGKLPWKDLFQPAIALAKTGFLVSPMLHKRIAQRGHRFKQDAIRRYFLTPNGKPLPVGYRLKNPDYARTLRLIADKGPKGFYQGEIAQNMVEAVSNHANPGLLSLEDIGTYAPKQRSAICLPYRQFTICGMPPSTSGGVTVLQILKLLEPFSFHKFKPNSLMTTHLISEASKLAYADRKAYIADPDYVLVPTYGLIDKTYLRKRARLIDPGRAAQAPKPGKPPSVATQKTANGINLSQPSTTHFSIIDASGNGVSMTSSIETGFGAHIMVGGFLLNNQLTDFSFRPTKDGQEIANRVNGGKRPRSSMSPILVFDKAGKLYAVLGSPGGSRIIAYVAQSLVALLDWNMDMQQAITLPRHVARAEPIELEKGTPITALAEKLRKLGHKTKITPLVSGLHGIRITRQGLEGGADPRREGVVLSGVRVQTH